MKVGKTYIRTRAEGFGKEAKRILFGNYVISSGQQ